MLTDIAAVPVVARGRTHNYSDGVALEIVVGFSFVSRCLKREYVERFLGLDDMEGLSRSAERSSRSEVCVREGG